MPILFRRYFLFIATSLIPLSTFSLTAADFNKAIATTNQQNQPSIPQYRCPTNNSNTSLNNTPAAPTSAPLYYAPSAPASADVPVSAPANAPASPTSNNSSGIMLNSSNNSSKNTTQQPFLVTY